MAKAKAKDEGEGEGSEKIRLIERKLQMILGEDRNTARTGERLSKMLEKLELVGGKPSGAVVAWVKAAAARTPSGAPPEPT